MICKNTFRVIDPIPACLDELAFIVPAINTQVTMTITDKFKKVYYLTGLADSEGLVTFDVAPLPPFLLTPYAGIFRATFSTISQGNLSLDGYAGIEFTIGPAGVLVDDYATEDYSGSDYDADGIAVQPLPIDLRNL